MRFVHNHFVAERRDTYAATGTSSTKYDQIKELPVLKKQYAWLGETDSTSLQAAVENVDTAYKNFFRRMKQGKKPGYPRFKRKHDNRQSFKIKNIKRQHKDGTPGDTVRILPDGHSIRLAKLGSVECRISKQVHGRILSGTISVTSCGKYFVSLNCTDVPQDVLPKTGKEVGVDLGLKDAAITSDEKKYPAPRHLRESEEKLKKNQKRLSRKTKGSKRYNKQRERVARIHEHIANQRLDTNHKMTTELVRQYDTICIEDLHVQNMMKNHKLAKSIGDAGWYQVRSQLEYKCERYGKTLVIVDRFFPSTQLCSVCGNRSPVHIDLDVREWDCPLCHTDHDRDINAAVNILHEGLRIQALTYSSRTPEVCPLSSRL